MFWNLVNSRFLPLDLHEEFPERIAGSTRKYCLYSWQLYLLCTSPNSLGFMCQGVLVSGITLEETGNMCSCACVIPIKFILLFRSGRLQPQLRIILPVNLPQFLLSTSWFQSSSILAHKTCIATELLGFYHSTILRCCIVFLRF